MVHPQFKNDESEALKIYEKIGYHIEYNFISDEMVDSIIKEAHKIHGQKDEEFRPLMMPHRQSPLFADFIKNDELVKIISLLIGGQGVGIQSEFFFSKPTTSGFAAHQDNFYVEANPNYFVSAWTALTDVGEHNGGLYFYPGSHKCGKLPVKKLEKIVREGQDPNANDQETIVPEGSQKIFPEIPKGAIVFLHSEVVHGSCVNKSNFFRYALLNTYIKKGEYFRPGNHAKRAEIS